MREVSCRALGALLKASEKAGTHDRLLAGVPHDVAYLQNTKNRIDWDVWVRVLRNAGSLWTLEELSDLNKEFTRSPVFAYVGVVARMLFTARDLFDWICKKSVGAGAQLFGPCVKPTYEHVGDDVTIIRLEIQPEYEAAAEFMWMTRGAFVTLPRLVGAGDADVTLDDDGRLGTFRVRYRNKRGTLASLLRWIALPFTARAAARALKSANEALQERFYELEVARVEVERQRESLDVAYQVGNLISGQRDVAKIVDIVISTLMAKHGLAGVRVTVQTPAIDARGGTQDGEPVRVEAAENGRGIVLEGWSHGDAAGVKSLLELVAPTIALAIDNAVYQSGLEQLVDQRTAELRKAQASREKFFGNISHEIRTPLSLIMLAARDIQSRAGVQLDERSSAGLVSITEGARKLLRLVDELLLLAAGQEDKLVLAPEPMDLVALASQIAAAWRPAAEAGGLTLTTELPAALAINADPVAIERVISNLLSNAVKYTPSGGTVTLSVSSTDAGPVIRVVDTGRGIDADLAKRLFGRFERAAGDDRRKAGTGIGLALVKQLIDGHGGSVEAIPRTPGSEFRVSLPASIVVDNVRVAETKLRTTHAPTATPVLVSGQMFSPPGVSKGTILVAEDDPRLADSIARLLADHYTVVVALDGLDALEQVRRHAPQLLITDVDMPGMTGIELAAKFREVTGDKLSPIIILSAVVDLNTRLAGLEAGAVDYVGKPFEPKELLARVEAQFRTREMAMRLNRAEQLSTLGILTSGLAHELRNPANGIVNAIEPLRECLPQDLLQPDSAVGELLDVMKSSADQMQFLVNQLLGFRSNSELALRQVALSDLITRAVRFANGSLTGIDVRVTLDGTSSIMCAPPLMVQVLTNLIENAGHAAGKGGWVQVRSAELGGKVAIEVTDSGPGVPPALRERIFEPFFTTKDPKSGAGGTGLGLSVARTIIHRHRGTLELRQTADRTAFVIELPHSNLV